MMMWMNILRQRFSVHISRTLLVLCMHTMIDLSLNIRLEFR